MTVISILYLVSLYGIQAVLLGPIIMSNGSGDMEISWNMFPVAVVLNLILAVVTIAVLVKNVKRVRGNISLQKQLNHLALAMKVLTVPFFITHLQLWMLVSAAFLVVPGLQILLLSGFLGVAFAWSVVLVTSTYSISGLYVQWKNGALSHGKFIRDVILQLIFVVDVISYFVFYIQIRRSCREQQWQAAEKTQESEGAN